MACGSDSADGSTEVTQGFDPAALSFPNANLVLISMDTLRADRLGVYGNTRGLTPNIDAFAASAVLFEEAYSNSPKTASSHMSLFTSRLPTVHKVRNQSARLDLLSPTLAGNRLSIAQVLNRAGYLNVGLAGGANVHPDMGFAKGFRGNFSSQLSDFSDQVKSAGKHWRTLRKRPEPSFMFVHSYQVHGPYLPPAELQERFVRTPSPLLEPRVKAFTGLPRHEQWRLMNKGGLNGHPAYWDGKENFGPAEASYLSDLYDAAIADMDVSMGDLFARLENQGAFADSIIVLLADHGEEFFEHGGFEHNALHREHLHVPLLVRLPDGHLGGTRVRGLAQLIDVMPTLLDLLVLEGPDDLQGQSLTSAMQSGRVAGDRPVIAENVMFLPKGEYGGALRNAAGLVIYDWDLSVDPAGRLEAFDLNADPREQSDQLGASDGLQTLAKSLKAVLADAHRLRDLLDATDAGGTMGDNLGADDAAALSQGLAAMGYFGGGDEPPPEVTDAQVAGTPLEDWPEDG
ncbi:MAG: hypothetical protein DHS20C15_08780 [Planctomycetota bacterium]|nr:MAG: hypothetical protein DHS20C15_08780 [Planctomycetota bacterium]